MFKVFRMLKADVYKTRNFWCTNGRLGSAPNCYRLSGAQVSVWQEGFSIFETRIPFFQSCVSRQDRKLLLVISVFAARMAGRILRHTVIA